MFVKNHPFSMPSRSGLISRLLLVGVFVLAITACDNQADADQKTAPPTVGEANTGSVVAPETVSKDASATVLPETKYEGPALNTIYPDLSSEGLQYAVLAELPEGVLLHAGDQVIMQDAIDTQIKQAPAEIQEQLRKNAFFLLEQSATEKLVLQEIRKHAGQNAGEEQAMVQAFFQDLTQDVKVSDEDISKFYEESKDMLGGAALEDIKEQIRQFLVQNEQQKVIQKHIQTIGQRMPVAVSAEWVKNQAALAKDNPIDQARGNGKPTFVNFGAKGCVPCDMMEPIRETIEEKYKDQLNVVFVHVNQEQVLASRFGITSIPVLVFYDAKGKEVARDTGYRPQDQIEERLSEIGVK